MKKIIFLFFVIFLVACQPVEDGKNNKEPTAECQVDSDCVPKQACHPTDCVPSGQEDNKEGIACTEECKPGTLDCGGRCICQQGQCEAVISR